MIHSNGMNVSAARATASALRGAYRKSVWRQGACAATDLGNISCLDIWVTRGNKMTVGERGDAVSLQNIVHRWACIAVMLQACGQWQSLMWLGVDGIVHQVVHEPGCARARLYTSYTTALL